jgi:glycosyltransferase involved in cell wall biosynthesis
MRIAMIGSRGLGSNYGGVERCLDALCPHLVRMGHEVDVFSARGLYALTPTGARNIPTYSVGGKHLSNLSRSTLATLCAIHRYDVLHFHATGPAVLSVCTRLTGQVSVATVHALDQYREKWGVMARKSLRLAEGVLVHSADQLTVVSANLRDYFAREHDCEANFIPNGVAVPMPATGSNLLERFGLEPGKYMLFAGRMTPEKGCHDLIAVFNRANVNSMKLLIAGGNGSAEYVERVRKLADPRRVVLAGHLTGEDLGAAFTHAHSFALPSYIEGMSLSLLEGIAHRLPLLVSDIAENRSVCGGAPLYFHAGQLHQLQAAVEHLCALPAPVLQYRVDSSKLPRWSDVARQYQAVYNRALSTRERGVHAGVPRLH